MTDDLVLDPLIRDFVLLPIVALMLLVSILRHYLTVVIGNSEKKSTLPKLMPAYVAFRSISKEQVSWAH